MSAKTFAIAAGLAFSMAAADAQPTRVGAGGAVVANPVQLAYSYTAALKQLHEAAVDQRRRDGGTLTPEHAAAFQRRLDRLNDFHRQKLANNNPLTVDASGHPVEAKHVTNDWTDTRLYRVGTPN